jgi:hypothetical protein
MLNEQKTNQPTFILKKMSHYYLWLILAPYESKFKYYSFNFMFPHFCDYPD